MREKGQKPTAPSPAGPNRDAENWWTGMKLNGGLARRGGGALLYLDLHAEERGNRQDWRGRLQVFKSTTAQVG